MKSYLGLLKLTFCMGILTVSPACKTKKSGSTNGAPPPANETCVASLNLIGEDKIDPRTLQVSNIAVDPVEQVGQMRIQLTYNPGMHHDVAWYKSCLVDNPKSCVVRVGPLFTFPMDENNHIQVNLEDGFQNGKNKITGELCVFSSSTSNAFNSLSEDEKKKFEKPLPDGYPNPKNLKLYCGNSDKSYLFMYSGWTNPSLQKLQADQRSLYDQIFSKARSLQRDLAKYLQDKNISTANPPNNLSPFDKAAVNIVNLRERYGSYIASVEFERNLPVMYAGQQKALKSTGDLKLADAAQEGCITEDQTNKAKEVAENEEKSITEQAPTPTAPVPVTPTPSQSNTVAQNPPAPPVVPQTPVGDDDTGTLSDEEKCYYLRDKNKKNYQFKNGQCWDLNNLNSGPLDIETMMAPEPEPAPPTEPIPMPKPPEKDEIDNTWAYGLIGSGITMIFLAERVMYTANVGYEVSKINSRWITQGGKIVENPSYPEIYNRYFATSLNPDLYDSVFKKKIKGAWDLTEYIGGNLKYFGDKVVNGFHGIMQGSLRSKVYDFAITPKISKELQTRYSKIGFNAGVVALAGVVMVIAGASLFDPGQSLVSNDLTSTIKQTAKDIRQLRQQFVDNGEKINEILNKSNP